MVWITCLILVTDQWSKQRVLDRFYLGESLSVLNGFFNITYVRNTGAAFGMLRDAPSWFRVPFFILIPLIAIGIIFSIYRQLSSNDRWMGSALALIVGGAIGNFIDRIRLGYVVDFLDFHWNFEYHFWIFNIADSAICVGVGMILLQMLRQPARKGS